MGVKNKIQHRLRNWTTETSSLFIFVFTSGVTTNGIYSTRFCRHISSCPRPIRHLFLCSLGQLLNCQKRPLALVKLRNQMNSNLRLIFCFHIQYATRCLFEQRRLMGSPEVAGSSFCLSIPLQENTPFAQVVNWLGQSYVGFEGFLRRGPLCGV